MKRRKTVSVTPAIGARTVAGAISIPPILKDAGTRACSCMACSRGLSQVFFIEKLLWSPGYSDPDFYVWLSLLKNLIDCHDLLGVDAKSFRGNFQNHFRQ